MGACRCGAYLAAQVSACPQCGEPVPPALPAGESQYLIRPDDGDGEYPPDGTVQARHAAFLAVAAWLAVVLLAGLFAAAQGDLAWLAGAVGVGAATVVGLVGYAFSPRARTAWATFLRQFGRITEVRLDERNEVLRFVGPRPEDVVPLRDLRAVHYDRGDGETPPSVRFICAGGAIRTGEPLLFSLLIERLRTLAPGLTVKGWDDA